MFINKKLNGSFFYKIICIFALLSILSFAEENETKLQSFFNRVIDKGVVSINTAPELIPSLDSMPPAGALPIDIEINRIATQLHKSPIFPDRQAKINQMKFLKKNRNTFSKCSKKSINKVNNYFNAHKGSLDALNNIQKFANVMECIQSGKTKKQCATKIITDVAISKSIGWVIGQLGLGSLATGSALIYADYQAVINVHKLYNEVTDLIEDEAVAEKQKRDRMTLDANVGSMESYLKLMLVRYEENQNKLGNHLRTFWVNAEDALRELKTAEEEFKTAWEKVKNKKYPSQLQASCEKSADLNKQCSFLINTCTAITGNSMPKEVADIASVANEFKGALNDYFEEKCIGHLDDIRKDIDNIMQIKVYPVYYWYKRLETSVEYARYAQDRYYADKKSYIQRNESLNSHYEQQLADRYGKEDSKYKKGIAILDQIKDQIKTYQSEALRKQKLMSYIDIQLNILQDSLKYKKIDLNSIFKDIKTHIEAISKTEKDFKSTVQSKSEKLASKFKTCMYDKINKETNSCKEKYSSEIESIEKEIDLIKEFAGTTISKCAETKQILDKLQEEIKSEKNTFSNMKAQINDLIKKMKNAKKDKDEIEDNDKKIEKLATEIENLMTEFGEFSLKICTKTKTLNVYKIDDREHEKTFKWIQKNKKELKVYLKKVKERYKKIESHKNKIVDIIKEHKAVELKEIEMIEKSIQKMNTMSEKIDAAVAQVNGVLLENLKNVSIIYSRKQAVKKSLKKLSEECGEELKDEIKAFYARLNTIGLSRCSKGIETWIKGLKASSSKIKKEIVELTKKINQTKKEFKKDIKNIKKIQSLEKNRKITFFLVKNYLMQAKSFAVDGALCVVLSKEIMKKGFIPKVIGMELREALRVLYNKGFTNISSSKTEEAPSKGLENKVLTQNPDRGKKRVEKDIQIILNYYGDYMSKAEKAAALKDKLMAQKKCSKNTVKVWNKILKKVGCVCQGPVFVWNINGTACITQQEAEEERKSAAMVKANCSSRFPGSENSWNSITKQVECICLGPVLVWNKAKTACITQKELEENKNRSKRNWCSVNNKLFVKSLYRNILDREVDVGGFNHWQARLKNGKSREWVMKQFFNSPEYHKRKKSNTEYIRDLYQATMGREPTVQEMTIALSWLNSGTTRSVMLSGLLKKSKNIHLKTNETKKDKMKSPKKEEVKEVKKDDVLRINGRRCWPRNYITPSLEDRKFYGRCDELQKKIDASK